MFGGIARILSDMDLAEQQSNVTPNYSTLYFKDCVVYVNKMMNAIER